MSIVTAPPTTFATLTESACDSYTVPSGNQTYTVTGTYIDTIANVFGGDSIITINLTITTPNVDIVGLDSSYCISDSTIIISGVPSGGTFSGSGITGNVFNPSSVGIGMYEITYEYTDPNSCVGVVSQDVFVSNCTGATGILRNTLVNDLKLYPNPNTGLFTIGLDQQIEEDLVLTITNVLGQVVYDETLTNISGHLEKQVDLRTLPSGIYNLGVTSPNINISKKVILK